MTGWIVILVGATTWEILSLFHYSIPTLSHQIRIVMTPVVGRAALLVAWLAVGFSLFGPHDR